MKKTLLVAACSFAIDATTPYLVLIPEGIFRGIDGRPTDAPHWELTPERGRQIATTLNQRSIDLVVDYEHATLKAQESGDPAPASGWLKPAGFQYIDGVGLCSTIFEWTEKAKGYIAAKEYKYTSPVFFYNKAGEVLGLHSFALTNTPNLDTLPEARLAAAAQEFFAQNLTQDSEMDELLEQLRWMLNLPLSATAEEILAELGKLQQQIKEKTGVALAANSQNLFDAIAAIEQLKLAANSQATPDLTQFVPMAVYQEAVNQASTSAAQAKAKEIDDLILAACSDGRLTGEATINWAKDQAKTNPDFIKTHIESLPKIAALTQKQTTTVDLNKQTPQTDPLKDDVFSMLGVSAADVEKYGA
ncbi:phage protease [Acinetobacter corruptisaponis]|uniref:Phage protease n=1 Tax=Acinetobacter corruptisaponis TaxID=3045147 RepID=A0ABY8RZQ9_9GAMM|nr:phage protease [Acinetobacter sp. KCTC 92772]WHP04760.1 phage protease [Acinetobacter sp. KCTC 92772]